MFLTRKSCFRKKGFTLAEILVVVVVIGVVASLAVPSYFSTVEQSRSNEARTNLSIIHMGEKIYQLNNGVFWDPPIKPPTVGTINTGLGVDISATYYTTFTFSNVTATTYTVTLTRNLVAGGKGLKTFTYTYNTAANPQLLPSEGGSY